MDTQIRLAIDRTINTNHTGFFVALAKGYYKEVGLDVQIIGPDQDDFQVAPAKRVAQGKAELAITPSESIISYRTKGIELMAVAAVLARDISAIVTLKESGISRPRELDGKTYASYGARFEEDIVRLLIQNDGGEGKVVAHKTGWGNIWQALLTGEVDAAWIWLTWEGVKAEVEGVELNQFLLDEYQIPYGYNPVLTGHCDWIRENENALRRFLKATAAGYQYAARKPDAAAHLLVKAAKDPLLTDNYFLAQSQQMACSYYLDADGRWGFMHRNVWNSFTNWMIRNELLTDQHKELIQHLDSAKLFTNEYLLESTVPVQPTVIF
ncbi:ABC transporter substrate-binding protein [Spirosoma pomorum]